MFRGANIVTFPKLKGNQKKKIAEWIGIEK